MRSFSRFSAVENAIDQCPPPSVIRDCGWDERLWPTFGPLWRYPVLVGRLLIQQRAVALQTATGPRDTSPDAPCAGGTAASHALAARQPKALAALAAVAVVARAAPRQGLSLAACALWQR